MDKNTKILSYIFLGIVSIIILIVGIYFTTYLFNVKDQRPEEITTTKYDPYREYINLNKEEKIKLDTHFNDRNLLTAFNNAFDNNYNIINANLLEKEDNKFKFIYTYLILNNQEVEINFEILNMYSNKIFNTNLYEENFNKYLVDDNYKYEINNYDITYCLKTLKKKENKLLLDMVRIDKCDNYKEEDIINKIELEYEKIEDDYIYKSYKVIK